MAQPLLSLCMIVKNEEAMLPGLLASVEGLWDELLVADTGSTDGTVALLEQVGATVVSHVWVDDFAAARNASLAAATGHWVLFLDADERVDAGLQGQIQKLLTDESAGAATVVMRNELPGGTHRDANLLRLFRRDPGIRFRHRIHEDVLEDVEFKVFSGPANDPEGRVAALRLPGGKKLTRQEIDEYTAYVGR